jgi:hypothetical protein
MLIPVIGDLGAVLFRDSTPVLAFRDAGSILVQRFLDWYGNGGFLVSVTQGILVLPVLGLFLHRSPALVSSSSCIGLVGDPALLFSFTIKGAPFRKLQ